MRNIIHSKTNRPLLIAIIILLLALLFLVWKFQLISFGGEDDYHAVLLTSGEMYYGKLHSFPSLYLTNIYLLQRNPESEENPFQLVKFQESFWGPEDYLKLSSENIIWITKLRQDSQVVNFIKSRENTQ